MSKSVTKYCSVLCCSYVCPRNSAKVDFQLQVATLQVRRKALIPCGVQRLFTISLLHKTQAAQTRQRTDSVEQSPYCETDSPFLLKILTLRLLMSYIYGAPSKARNANVVYIWTYVWQR